MNFKLPDKERFREGELAKAIDKHISTVGRWTRRGVRGQVLRSYLLGGQRYINRQDFLDFMVAINGSVDHDVVTPGREREAELQRVNAELDRMGL